MATLCNVQLRFCLFLPVQFILFFYWLSGSNPRRRSRAAAECPPAASPLGPSLPPTERRRRPRKRTKSKGGGKQINWRQGDESGGKPAASWWIWRQADGSAASRRIWRQDDGSGGKLTNLTASWRIWRQTGESGGKLTNLAASWRIGGKPTNQRQAGGSAENRWIGGKPAAADNPRTPKLSALLTCVCPYKYLFCLHEILWKKQRFYAAIYFSIKLLQCTVHLVE